MNHSYYLSVDTSCWSSQDQALLSCVSSRRREKIRLYARLCDRKLSLYAALLARLAILRHSPLTDNARLEFDQADRHKPRLLFDGGPDFSFSHTEGGVLCALSTDAFIGADLESLRPAPLEVMEYVFHPCEIRYVTQISDPGRKNRRFFEVWTRKEAFTKCKGLGLVCDLPSINTLDDSLSDYFHTWEARGCICSVYVSSPSLLEERVLSEKDIWDFFLPFLPADHLPGEIL